MAAPAAALLLLGLGLSALSWGDTEPALGPASLPLLAGMSASLVLIAAVAMFALGRRRPLTYAGQRPRDIEAALENAEASESRMRAVVDHAAEAIITIDPSGIIQSFNPAAERIFGYAAAEAIGANVSMLMPSPERERHDGYVAHYLRTGEARIIGIGREVTGRRKDGSPIALELAVTEMEVGGARWFCGIAHDISERKQAEAAIRASERKLRSYVEQSLDGLLVVDGAGRYLEANPAACSMLGYSEAELLERSIAQILDTEDANLRAGSEHFRRVVLTGTSKGEVALRRKDGSRIIAEIHAVALGNDRFLGLLRDVTERRLAKQALESERALLETRVAERTEVLTRTNATLRQEVNERRRVEAELVHARELALQAADAKARFLANMSHEIRTPMNAVIGSAELLRDTPLDPEQHGYVETICASGDMLLATIQDILDFSKIESGMLELEERPIELGHSIEEAFDIVAPRAAERDIDLFYMVENDAPAWIAGDAARLRQVLVNLLSNAVKFTERGEVCLSVARAPDSDARPVLHFTVRDTGIGIPAAKMGHLFRAFSQTDPSMTRRYGGTGLGLAICARLVAMAGGQIWAESEEGRGSAFHFTLPARVVAAGAAPQYAREPLAGLAGKRVLLATDNPIGLYILEEACRRWGLEVTSANNAPDAIAALGAAAFDAIVLDCDLPDLDGAALAREMRADGHAPALVALGSRSARHVHAPHGSRSAAFVAKPVKHSQLLRVLAEALGACVPGPEQPDPRPRLDATLGRRVPLAILVAEDSVINQKLTARILAKLGYECDIAANGGEVLERIALRHYDLVLMDLQMPVMDGIETTRRIVAEWPASMRPYLVAMTADVLPGDRDRCLAMGMDDYIAKPVLPRTLQRALERLAARNGLEAGAVDAPSIEPRTLEELRALDDPGKPSLLAALVQDYVADAPRFIGAMRRCAAAGDAPALAADAHKLAGISVSLGASAVARVCVRIEKRATAGALAGIEPLVAELESSFEATRRELAEWC